MRELIGMRYLPGCERLGVDDAAVAFFRDRDLEDVRGKWREIMQEEAVEEDIERNWYECVRRGEGRKGDR
jgi:hypothetical protein